MLKNLNKVNRVLLLEILQEDKVCWSEKIPLLS